MLFVFLSHFNDAYFGLRDGWGSRMHALLATLTMIASPTFVIISGAMLGIFHTTLDADRFQRLGDKLVDRGLFLLTVAHVLIKISQIPMFGAGWRFIFITDAIGVCVVVGPACARKMSSKARAVVGVCLVILTWIVVVGFQPSVDSPWILPKQVLFGHWRHSVLLSSFPLMPWLGLYLASSALGEKLGRRRVASERGHSDRTLLAWGALAIVAGASMKGMYELAKRLELLPTGDAGEFTRRLTAPLQKLPPSAAYLLFYGGFGLVLMGVIARAERSGRVPRILAWLSLIGRNSLVAFIIQFYVYYAALPLLRVPYSPFWPAYFLVLAALIVASLKIWETRDYGRFITVGYAAFRRHRREKTDTNSKVGPGSREGEAPPAPRSASRRRQLG